MENIKRPFEISQRILQAHCQSHTSQRYNQSFVKELAKPTQGKIELKKISSPSKNKKYVNAQTNTTKTMTKTQQGQWFTDTEDKNTSTQSSRRLRQKLTECASHTTVRTGHVHGGS
ncbi:MAG: hypothetical protein Q8J84_00245 [Flavobacteriaceae bacterium]|nr:hypothetical protein [Flavobacteriaceae bacterium]